MLSPDGMQVLSIAEEYLFVRDLAGGQRTQLTERPNEDDVFYQQPMWSPDSQRILLSSPMRPASECGRLFFH